MRKLFLFLCAALFASQVQAQTTFAANGLCYTITDATNHYVSVGYATATGDLNIEEKVTNPNDGLDYMVTSIIESGFNGCYWVLTSVTIPNSVTSIGDWAFADCYDLTGITIGNSVTSIGEYAFYNCYSLTEITIPNSVTSIGNSAFEYTYLTEVTIPSSVISIGEGAFNVSSDNLITYITDNGIKYKKLDENSVEVVANSYSGKVVIPQSITTAWDSHSYTVTSIGNSAFSGCSELTSVTIPNSVITIGDYAFNGCSKLESVTIPSSASIGNSAFSGCSELTSVTIPNSVITIGDYAFNGCSKLESVTIPSSASIGENAFSGCDNLTTYITDNGIKYKKLDENSVEVVANSYSGNVVIPLSITTAWDSHSYTVTSIGDDAFRKCSSLTLVTIPNSVTSIGSYAFSGCRGLTSVTIPNSVTSIGNSAFSGCSGLTAVTIGNSVTSIGGAAFQNCSVLTSVTIPNSVTTIGNCAFENCSSLTEVTIPEMVTSIGYSVFYKCISLSTITIPSTVTSIDLYAFGYCNSLTTYYITDNGIKYKKLDENSVEVVANSYSGKVVIPQSITTAWDSHSYTVTSIGSYAFYECSSMTSVTIPNSVTSIGSYAFSGCSGLSSIAIPSSVTNISSDAFCYCTGLTSVTIPGSVTSIGEAAFYCTALTSVDIPDGVISIGELAFSYCFNLQAVSIPNSVVEMPFTYSNDFDYEIIDGQVYSDGNYNKYSYLSVFSHCDNLKTVNCNSNAIDSTFTGMKSIVTINIGDDVTSIPDSAFAGCTKLKEVTIGKAVENIGKGAFDGCKTVQTLSFNTNAIGAVFAGCKYLNTINIGETVTTFDRESFAGCTNLTTINIDEQNANLASENGALYNKDKTTLIYCPAQKKDDFTMPKSVASIAEGALQDIGMAYKTENGAKYLGDTENPYRWLVSVEPSDNTLLTVNNRCEYIIGNAFNGCSNLAYINIPESVVEVGDKAFNGCSATLYCAATGRPGGWSSEASASKVFWGVNLNQSGFVYSPKKLEICDYIGDNKTNITIPQNLDGFTITSIGAKAFSNCPELQSVTIPATIKRIDKAAFSGCNNIKTLTCDTDSLGKCFAGRKSLETVVVGNNVTTITDGAFEDCSNLLTVNIGVMVKSIGDRAFANCSELRDLTIAGSVLSNIGKEAFRGCYKIKTAYLPNSVSVIGNNAFHYVKNVAYKGNAAGSPWGALTLNGVIDGDFIYLDDKKDKITAYIGDGSEVEIPQTVDNIGLMSFFESDNLKKVTIPDNSVVIINESAFGNCRNLEYINIPQSVAIIGYGAFRECYAVKIYCEVTSQPAMWDENWNYRITENQIVWGNNTAVSESAAAANIYAYGNTIVVENATDEIWVYDAMGKLVCRNATNRVRAEITIPSPGVYIVKTGNIAKRVMVK